MYINNLPEETKAKAIVNTLKEAPNARLDDILATELTGAFRFDRTPEGAIFWHDEDNKIKSVLVRK